MEIEGLRGVAIVLIIGYHVWLQRVSGGVDVFLLLSGFLVTLSLLRTVERQGRVQFLAFYSRTARRILPPAMVALVGILVATVVFLPQTRWTPVSMDVVHAVIQDVNYHLAFGAVDYLASREAASPVQHFWSLAIQNQFYLTWPILITVTIVVGGWLRIPRRVALGLVIGGLFAGSLLYSVQRTAVDQAFTYFDSVARIYELALGALFALVIPDLRLGRSLRTILGWAGLALLLSCGIVFRSGTEFPGWAGLWPTLGAVLIILSAPAGATPSFGLSRLLRSRPLVWLGSHSYALYLWHWPVLVCFLGFTGRGSAGPLSGLAVVAASFAVAIPSRWLVERRLLGSGIAQRTPARAFALAAGFLAVALVASVGLWTNTEQRKRSEIEASRDSTRYPGAAHLVAGGALPDVPYQPSALWTKDDLPDIYDLGCHQDPRDPEPITCEFGPANADRTIAIVGGSHSAQWVPAFQAVADEYGWRIVSITKSACRFEIYQNPPTTIERRSCAEWNARVLDLLQTLRPDVVFTTSTTGQGGEDRTPSSYIRSWQALEAMGIPVLAVRDNPWHRSDPSECVVVHGPDARQCGLDRAAHGLTEPAEIETRDDRPANVRLLDMTDYICEPRFCPAVIGNVLVYRDRHHLTATYARTIGPYLAAGVVAQMGWDASPLP